MLTFWKALVLSRIEYCCQLWSPHKRGEIIKLEAVQRSFASRISSVQHLNYWERLKALNLYSLQRRRERYTIIYVWKTLERIVPNVGIQVNEHPRRGRLCCHAGGEFLKLFFYRKILLLLLFDVRCCYVTTSPLIML